MSLAPSEAPLVARKPLTTLASLLKFEECWTRNKSTKPNPGALNMKNVYEVLRQKEMELTRLEKEVEALRLVAPLLSEEKEAMLDMGKPALATAVNGPQPTVRIPVQAAPAMPSMPVTPQPMRAAGWEDTAKRWP
jgi:hypothetical protein